jgi:uncharacterized protein
MPDQPLISVRGEAFREVPPELAVFSVTVSARDKDRQTTLTRLTERSSTLRAALDAYSDAIDRRETGGVQIQPQLQLKRGGEHIAAYHGSVTTTVTMTDFEVLGELLLRLAGQDQTSISGPWWRLRPGSTAGAEVRRDAIADALHRAREYADAVGARVDRLVEISDEGASSGARVRGTWLSSVASMEPTTNAELDIDPQQQTVQASVLVRVAITDPTSL